MDLMTRNSKVKDCKVLAAEQTDESIQILNQIIVHWLLKLKLPRTLSNQSHAE